LWCFVICVTVNARATRAACERAVAPAAEIEPPGSREREASAVLWARCCAVAQRVARRWASSGADADDLSQEALLRAVESFKGLRNPAALSGWMQVIVTRSVAKRVRIVRRKRDLIVTGDPELLPAGEPLPDFQVDLRRLLNTLGSLPEEERRCFWLRRCEGLGIQEIARETALSPSTVHRRLNVAEHRLAKRLREPSVSSSAL
jgi:RNA polymerase sigma-70 factor (ECF subfamily)